MRQFVVSPETLVHGWGVKRNGSPIGLHFCQALAIDRTLNGESLRGDILFLERGTPPIARIHATPRVGIDYAGPWRRKRWRFLLADSPWASRAPPGPKRNESTSIRVASNVGSLKTFTGMSPLDVRLIDGTTSMRTAPKAKLSESLPPSSSLTVTVAV